MSADSTSLNVLSLHVPMTRPLERLLHRAASNRDLTPEVLAKRILCDWLLAEGGFKQDEVQKRRLSSEGTGLSLPA